MLRPYHLPALFVLCGLTISPAAQAQPVSGGRSSAPGVGSYGIGGSSGAAYSQAPQIIGGRPGPSVGRNPPRDFMSTPLPVLPPGANAPAVPSSPPTRIEVFPRNRQTTPSSVMDGPDTGITLEEAVALLIHGNLDLRARFLDISQADSDVLTANLRSNPILFTDAQSVPYGAYNRAAGPIVYDVNIVYPLDVSHKRQTRTRAAVAARMVTEASYRDAVRLTLDNLYQAYIDALASQTVILRKARPGSLWSQVELDEPESALKQAQRVLALLINVPATEIESRKLYGKLEFDPAKEPKLDQTEFFVQLARENRPDLQAQRLTVSFAEANIKAILASRFDDLLLLYQPYTFFDGRPGSPPTNNNTLAWAVGVTVPLPIYNRQQGNILKARQAAEQARTRLAFLDQSAASGVEGAVLEHQTAHEALIRTLTEYSALRNQRFLARKVLKDIDIPSADLKNKLMDLERVTIELRRDLLDDKLKTYWETLIRHRKSMLRMNIVTGVCVSE
jgi:outer membrane protein, heavy metal efflux system